MEPNVEGCKGTRWKREYTRYQHARMLRTTAVNSSTARGSRYLCRTNDPLVWAGFFGAGPTVRDFFFRRGALSRAEFHLDDIFRSMLCYLECSRSPQLRYIDIPTLKPRSGSNSAR